jgi:hypothetical protein
VGVKNQVRRQLCVLQVVKTSHFFIDVHGALLLCPLSSILFPSVSQLAPNSQPLYNLPDEETN